jgi:hypothetical protein
MINIDAPGGPIQTFIPLVHRTIPEENTYLGTKLKFVCVVLMETRPTGTTESTKERVIRGNVKNTLDRCFLFKIRGWHTVDKIACG